MSEKLGHWFEKKGNVSLEKLSTKPPKGWEKETTVEQTEKLGKRMEELFDLMFFAGQHSFLIVLQGMDAAGKDGTIRHILRFSHAQSFRVASFKVPTEEELAHDFLWRVHKQTPRKGEIVAFNRSHYEDVGVVRVKDLVPEKVWRERYGLINSFESGLVAANTIVLKLFLHITKDEQEERLKEREADQNAYWKLNVGDWKEREFWDAYQKAYAEAIAECSSKESPWVVVPADKKWFRNYVVSQAIVEILEPFEKGWKAKLEKIGAEAKQELADFKLLES